MPADDDRRYMARALELARRGEGWVEPNPMVGCVIVRDGAVVGEGWHQRFGGPHAEIEALQSAGETARGATAYVTLEPCCHSGKTPPCTSALLAAGVRRVVAAMTDPNPDVNGQGLKELADVGVAVESGVLADEAADVIAPFAKLITQRRPWIIAKWAMTLDGRLATRTGDSKWISGEASRALVHQLRGRMDAILVGRGTVDADDPLLTARPSGARVATRIVLDSRATLPLASQLVRTVREAPVLVAAGPEAPASACEMLRWRGVDVWQSGAADRNARLTELLNELGRRQMTNVLVEGGSQVLGALFELRAVDEVHVFIAPRIIGGGEGRPIAGEGAFRMADAWELGPFTSNQSGEDIYIRARLSPGLPPRVAPRETWRTEPPGGTRG
jgi:diaminohydroxyphosphoribosylaminopyrimidine deaminase/5-amino-6-(5-phosphoribosylamino)uracil reductase